MSNISPAPPTTLYTANTLMQAIKAAWNLTDDLEVEGGPDAANRPYPLKFYAHDMLKAREWTKAIVVKNLTEVPNEFKGEFFKRVEQKFEIECRIKLQAGDESGWNYTETYFQEMANYLVGILDTIYNPWNGTGAYWESDRTWEKKDNLDARSPVLIRSLTITLSYIVARNSNVFTTFQRGVLIDLANSVPAIGTGTYQYTEVFDVANQEGYGTKELPITTNSDGQNIPLYYSTRFKGDWIGDSYLSGSDLGSAGQDINQLYLLVNAGEQRLCAFIQKYTNPAGKTLTKTTLVIINEVQESYPKTELATVKFIGKIVKPSMWSVA